MGQIGVEVNSQNFYINPDYQGVTFSIEPGDDLVIQDAIVFEPRTIAHVSQPMQMAVYLKS